MSLRSPTHIHYANDPKWRNYWSPQEHNTLNSILLYQTNFPFGMGKTMLVLCDAGTELLFAVGKIVFSKTFNSCAMTLDTLPK